jgi:hypothetical protein
MILVKKAANVQRKRVTMEKPFKNSINTNSGAIASFIGV